MPTNNDAPDVTALSRQATEARAIEPRPAAPVSQYATGFDGAACAPFPPDAAAVLNAPVPENEVEIRPDGIVYLPGVAYRRILIRAFGAGAWALLPRGPARTMDALVVYHGALYILGRFVSEAVGECETRFGMSYASSLEGARTDCLTRCCKDLGIATELWDPAWRDGWMKKYADREWDEGKDGKKGKWKYWLKDKAGDQTLLTGRNAGAAAPKADGPATPVSVPTPGPTSVAPVADPPVAPSVAQATPPEEAKPATKGRRKAAPKAEAPAEAPTTSPFTPPTGLPASTALTTGADTGEAPPKDLIEKLAAALKALRWQRPQAVSWLQSVFGVPGLGALTGRQATDALTLLLAAQIDDEDRTYADMLGKLQDAGRVK